jgi:hypothetical protein
VSVPKKSAAKKPKPVSGEFVREAMSRAQTHARKADWSGANESTVLGLFAWLHEQVYGVDPTQELRTVWVYGIQAVGKLIREEFNSITEVVEFVRWTWTRERGREKWRRDNGRPGGRVSWRTQF